MHSNKKLNNARSSLGRANARRLTWRWASKTNCPVPEAARRTYKAVLETAFLSAYTGAVWESEVGRRPIKPSNSKPETGFES